LTIFQEIPMRQFQIRTTLRFAALLGFTALATSGCHWFSHKGDVYKMSAETRPLEVPPDLDQPDTTGATQVPDAGTASVTRSSLATVAQPAETASGFTVPGDRDDIFNKVGAALAEVDGLTIASKAQLLGAYDVSYQGSDFLVRVAQSGTSVYVSAVDPRGTPATSPAAAQLIATLKSRLAGG
jgi:uncharacterized lipoprotein